MSVHPAAGIILGSSCRTREEPGVPGTCGRVALIESCRRRRPYCAFCLLQIWKHPLTLPLFIVVCLLVFSQGGLIHRTTIFRVR